MSAGPIPIHSSSIEDFVAAVDRHDKTRKALLGSSEGLEINMAGSFGVSPVPMTLRAELNI